MSSMLPLVIFGNRGLASMVFDCVTQDAGRIVAGFTVDAAYQLQPVHENLPLVPFENIESFFPPGSCELLIPLGWTGINGLRRARCEMAKEKGYRLASFVSRSASVPADFQAGENTMIFERAVIQPRARIGNNVIIRGGVVIGHHGIVDDHSYIANSVVTGGFAHIGEQCFVGLGAVLRDKIRIAPRCFIGAGAIMLGNTEPNGVYVGNPARRLEKSSVDV